MGMTHFSILKGLHPDLCFTIIEPNKTLRVILKKNIEANILKSDNELEDSYDITLITTPPTWHLKILKKCLERGDKRVFVEKPFGGHNNHKFDNILTIEHLRVGYVLRFNPCIQWIKSNIAPEKIISIHGQYLSNTIESKPTGWRNGPFSGVLNEMGSHIIDLLTYILDENEMYVQAAQIKSVISDVDDIVEAKLKTKNKVDVSIYLNWVMQNIRKPVFEIEIKTNEGFKYLVDQQQIKKYTTNEELIDTVTITDISQAVPFYLRGIDFTNQMVSLLKEGKEMSTAKEAMGVNLIMHKILRNENNIR